MDIKKFIPDHFITPEGTKLRAILEAINEGAARLNEMIEAGVDQQFVSTATGKYLLYLGEQEGFAMPPNSGLDIRALRSIIPAMIASPKQVASTINRLVEIFYTPEKLRPSAVASVAEPYNLDNGDDLIVETENGTIGFGLLATQVSDIDNVTAAELAGVINNAQSNYVADVYIDRKTNEKFLRVTSRTYGTGAYVKIVGGTMQNVLKFAKLRETTLQLGTTFNITKSATYTDVTKFTWNGVGTNPKLYLVKPDDVVTLRGLVDGVDQLSLLNGSYKVVDSGYDYFIIYNDHFPFVSATLAQTSDNNIVFTSNDKNILYDLEEYAIVSEVDDVTTTITVPAIPPLARRFLKGSAHLHGAETSVIDFTRSSITVNDSEAEVAPDANNVFVIATKHHRPHLEKSSQIKTNGADALSPRTYLLDYSDESYGTLPYTSVQPLGVDVLYAEPGEENIYLNFPFSHGLQNYWGMTIATTSQVGNLTAMLLNAEHKVAEAINNDKVRFKVYQNGVPIKFSGVTFTNFDVYRHLTQLSNSSDFYLQFPNNAAVVVSGLYEGAVFRIDGSLGTNLDPFLGERLRHAKLLVKSIDNDKVHFFAGFGAGLGGQIISSGTAYRSAYFGGNVSYYFDKTSAYNLNYVTQNMTVNWLGYTPSVNSAYVGSFAFDPTGIQSKVTLSDIVVKNAQVILKGSNQISIFADTVEGLPNSGYLMLNYGSSKQEGPIFYLSVIQNNSGASQILIDPAYRFKHSHVIGENIQYIHKLEPYVPKTDGSDYPVYVTGTAQARNTLFILMELLIATGVFLDINILFPNLRFDDPAISPFE